MADLNEVHEWLRKHKKELKELQGILEDELSQDDEYRRIAGEIDMLRERKGSMEDAVRAGGPAVAERMEVLEDEIRKESELLRDIALNTYVKGESADITDSDGRRWSPVFSVRFTEEEGAAMTDELDPEEVEAIERFGQRASAELSGKPEHEEFEPAM